MHKTIGLEELSPNELNRVSGGSVYGTTGDIHFGAGEKGAAVSWPGAVGGVAGTWNMSSRDGLSWRPT